MSLLQRISRTIPWKNGCRNFSTTRTSLSSEISQNTTPAKPTGLYQFFENNEALPKQIWTGRAWKAQELRQKSFEDLHKLWYVLLKERNLLATQKEEARRLGLPKEVWTNQGRAIKCQKSMARIKRVLHERQLEYEKTLLKKDSASATTPASK
ncbi:mitochondrial 39-S ribosomal protein L47 (MRP-L47)-domain-containing protein [Mycotypha africana]|uniref:mitochondrial 39-S ribosomal protein L47 (MRP-L47)-domain-containing protein n=1 Tax=Mycotypha africana TaxID=64632 RepID=UPI0023004936|nr:mitochondrial 39-S ribosomal protein L47 (MRP-L47)-domain-containing protein [Mycotypha africana]KAI8971465.1 mitochondrial 39-S ribosomal protein L47 (MRP-L47)-domain-containing protein [Mycotypha africana]